MRHEGRYRSFRDRFIPQPSQVTCLEHTQRRGTSEDEEERAWITRASVPRSTLRGTTRPHVVRHTRVLLSVPGMRRRIQ
eukprot:156092-Rhodomonas_salina.1